MKDPLYYKTDLFASKSQRFANFVVDLIFRTVLLFAFGIVAGLLTHIGYDGLFIWTQNLQGIGETVFGISLMMIYYLFMEMITQRTVGKFITGTQVVMEDGSKPPAGVIAIRTLCRLIPFDAFSFFGETGRGWHDSVSNTYVVDIKKYNAALELENSFEEIGSELKY